MTEEFEVKIGRVSLEGFTTAELVTELAKRENVIVGRPIVKSNYVYHISECDIETPVVGPCKVLVVRE